MHDLLLSVLGLVGSLAICIGLGLLSVGKAASNTSFATLLTRGFLGLLLLLGVMNIFVSLASIYLLLAVIILSVTGLIRGCRKFTDITPFGVLAGAGASIWLGFLSIGRISNYDPGLYYHSFIAFMRDDKLVWGLANLHTRLGNWSAPFALSAWFQNGPIGYEGYRLANSLLIVVVLAAVISTLRKTRQVGISPAVFLQPVGIAFIFSEVLTSPGFFIAAPSPDTGFALTSVMALGSAIDRKWGVRDHEGSSWVWAVLSILYRPQGLVVLLAILFLRVDLLGMMRNADLLLKKLREHSLAVCGLLLYPVLTIILSGHFLYPVSSLPQVLPWAVPEAQRSYLSDQITWIARQGPLPETVDFRGFGWVADWIVRNFGLIALLVIVAVSGLVVSKRACQPLDRVAFFTTWVIIGTPVVVWFVLAPDPRFGLGPLGVFALLPWVRCLKREPNPERQDGVSAALLYVAVAALAFSVVLPLTRELGARVGDPQTLGIPEPSHLDTPRRVVADLGNVVITRPLNTSGPECGAALWCTPEDVSGIEIIRWGPFTVLSRN